MSIILDGTSGITATGSLTGLTTAISAAQGGTGLTSPGTAGNILTSNGTAWTSSAPAASGSITLLGTVNATSGNSVSLGSLSLSSYKELHIVTNSVSTSGATAAVYVSSDNSQTANYFASYLRTALVNSGVLIVNLATGAFSTNCSSETDPTNGVYLAGKLNITTATTTIYFRLGSTNVYNGSGSFLVYGVL